jgi:hypothetical protein
MIDRGDKRLVFKWLNNGRWPLNLLHPEHIPLEMENGMGGASRWNTLRALRVLRYNNSTW